MTTSDSGDIISELEGLSVHYLRPVRTEAEQARFLVDYVDDLRVYPLDAIKAACARWRRSDATKFPTVGQLLPIVRGCSAQAKASEPKPWAPITDIEYAALSLRDKIRHHECAAYDAQTKVPPMWWQGRAVSLEEMPAERAEAHRFWSGRVHAHFAEAASLKGALERARKPA